MFCALGITYAHSQVVGVRFDLGAPGGSGVTTVTGNPGYSPLYTVPNVSLAFCSYPANAVPCTNYVTTYTDLTLTTACATNAQIVLQGTTACVGTSDNYGDLGVNIAAGGTYSYTLTSNGVSSGPYTVSIGVSGTASTPVTTPVSCPGSTLFPITSEAQTFAVTLTANCMASALTAVATLSPPALVIFQITNCAGGGCTFSWPSNLVGGAQIASGAGAVTVQAFTWNGTTATAIGSANEGAGPLEVAGTYNATTGFECAGSFGTTGYFLQSTGTGCVWAPASNSLLLANASSTGTTVNTLTKATGAPSKAVIAATTDASGVLGITTSGAGTTGTATILQSGETPCVFDGATTAGDYVVISSTTAGNCHDSGLAPPSLPPVNSQLIGQVLSSNVGAGTYQLDIYGPGLVRLTCSSITTKSSAYLVSASDCIVQASVSGGSFILMLPHAAIASSWQITRTDSSSNALTVEGDSGNINGGASLTIPPLGTIFCHADGTNAWCTPTASFNAPQRVALGGTVALTGGAQTIVLTESVTFPASGGPYRADVRYGVWVTAGGVNECGAEVIDTTNNRAFALSGQDGNGSVPEKGMAASEVSSATYAAGATATFTLQMICVDTSGATVNSANFTFSPAEASYLSVTPVSTH